MWQTSGTKNMSTESIARAAARLAKGTFSVPKSTGLYLGEVDLLADATPVDVQTLRDSVDDDTKFQLYEDAVLRPPWVNALLGYETDNGVTCLVHVTYEERPDDGWGEDEDCWQPENLTANHGEPVDEVPHEIDWGKVRWVATVTYWLSGSVPTSGPHHLESVAIDAEGVLQDLRWTQLRPDISIDYWETAQWVWLKAITFLNCTNVTLVIPHRTRVERRRLARISDKEVTEIQVFKSGRSVQGAKHPPGDGVPLTTVRGHVARYGPKFNRGLLFGKHEGEFWIPQSARGRAGLGTHDPRYTIRNETP